MKREETVKQILLPIHRRSGRGIIMLVMGGSLVGAVVLLVGAMFWTGRLAPPGTEAYRLRNARAQAKISELEAETADHRFRTAQAVVNRQLLEAKSIEELQKIHDMKFSRGLEAG